MDYFPLLALSNCQKRPRFPTPCKQSGSPTGMVMWIKSGVWGSEGPQGPSTPETNFYNFPKIRHSEPLPTSSQIKILYTVGPRVALQTITSQSSNPKEKYKILSRLYWFEWYSVSPIGWWGERGHIAWLPNLQLLFCFPSHLLIVTVL